MKIFILLLLIAGSPFGFGLSESIKDSFVSSESSPWESDAVYELFDKERGALYVEIAAKKILLNAIESSQKINLALGLEEPMPNSIKLYGLGATAVIVGLSLDGLDRIGASLISNKELVEWSRKYDQLTREKSKVARALANKGREIEILRSTFRGGPAEKLSFKEMSRLERNIAVGEAEYRALTLAEENNILRTEKHFLGRPGFKLRNAIGTAFRGSAVLGGFGLAVFVIEDAFVINLPENVERLKIELLVEIRILEKQMEMLR